MQDLPGYGAGACLNAVAINDVGQVTGDVGVGFWFRPFVHLNDPIFFPNLNPFELGGIDLGDIVGPGPNIDPNDQTWSGGGNAINNKGHVAGQSVFPGVGSTPSFSMVRRCGISRRYPPDRGSRSASTTLTRS